MLQRGRARAGAEWYETDEFIALSRISFNGAAPARARNGYVILRHMRRATGFNGAAPARARNAQIGVVAELARASFNGAAPARARNAVQVRAWRIGHRVASTGPRPRGRGMLGAWSTSRLAPPRFNGAAPARARNDITRIR